MGKQREREREVMDSWKILVVATAEMNESNGLMSIVWSHHRTNSPVPILMMTKSRHTHDEMSTTHYQ